MITSIVALLGANAYADQPAADDAPDSPRAQEPDEERWYVTHILLADAASMAALLVGLNDHTSEALAAAGVAGLVFGAPLIHRAMGQRRQSAISLALRMGVPLLVYLVAPEDDGCVNVTLDCGIEQKAQFMAVGMAVVSGIDMYMSRIPGPATPAGPATPSTAARATNDRGVMLAPTFAISERSVGLGVVGQF